MDTEFQGRGKVQRNYMHVYACTGNFTDYPTSYYLLRGLTKALQKLKGHPVNWTACLPSLSVSTFTKIHGPEYNTRVGGGGSTDSLFQHLHILSTYMNVGT